jgi:hypothetical protein
MEKKWKWNKKFEIGYKYNKTTVIGDGYKKCGSNAYLCRCDCGDTFLRRPAEIKKGLPSKCVCDQRRKTNKTNGGGRNIEDLTGKKIHNLLVLERVSTEGFKKAGLRPGTRWLCLCDCGNKKIMLGSNLRNTTKSCGCLLYRRGEDSCFYKGNWYTNSNGYMIRTVRDKDGKSKHVSQHRIVMEEVLGRKLLPNENVHHINGIKTDNRPANLELWVKTQPCGQRASDLLSFSLNILKQYAPELLLPNISPIQYHYSSKGDV